MTISLTLSKQHYRTNARNGTLYPNVTFIITMKHVIYGAILNTANESGGAL